MITVVTGNKGKAAEVAAFFDGIVEVTHTPFEAVERRPYNLQHDLEGWTRVSFRLRSFTDDRRD